MPVQVLPLITSFTFDGIQDLCDSGGTIRPRFTAVFSGGTATISFVGSTMPVTSGVQFAFGAVGPITYTFTVTNSSGSAVSALTQFPYQNGVLGCGIGGAPPL